MDEPTDILALFLKTRDILFAPALKDLVRLDPSFPKDYEDTLTEVLEALVDLHDLRVEASDA